MKRYDVNVVEFLLHPYIGTDVEIDGVEQNITSSDMPTSIKFTLMDLVGEYRTSNKIALWEKYNFVELAYVVKQYLNFDTEYTNMISQCTSMKQVRLKFDVVLKEMFNQELSRSFYYYVEMCYVRNNARYKEWQQTFF